MLYVCAVPLMRWIYLGYAYSHQAFLYPCRAGTRRKGTKICTVNSLNSPRFHRPIILTLIKKAHIQLMSMPLGRTIIDGLWQYMCPSSSRILQKGFHVTLRPGARSFMKCRVLQQRQTHTQSFPTRPRIGLRSSCQLTSLQFQQSTHQKPFLVGQHACDQARIRDLDNTSAYQELRRSTLKGNYARIRDLVKTLVKERGQKPNLRLYDALLLANTDNRYGSAGEVARILDEVAVEGLTPDSATYHAALRVRDRAREVRYSLAYTR